MPAIRTEITEIVTGLAMLGFPNLDRVLAVRPDWLIHVGPEHFDRLDAAHDSGEYQDEFAVAWENGKIFLQSSQGLRGRAPFRVEWKGPHRPPGYEQLPADLRVDHVYLISCKYGSNVLHNASPSHLFDRRLSDRMAGQSDWFSEVASDQYQELYLACRDVVGGRLPVRVGDLQPADRDLLAKAFKRRWPDELVRVYEAFAWAVARVSAERWRSSIDSRPRKEEMVWRLLRLEAVPYFVLGLDAAGNPIRCRIDTPFDFRERYRLVSFDVFPEAAGQPLVGWRIETAERSSGVRAVTQGHVEIRWSHGRFSGAPEAKVYLDTPHHLVSGYRRLDAESDQAIF